MTPTIVWPPQGEPVDVQVRAPDAPYILECEEFDLGWQFAEVHESCFPETGVLVREEAYDNIRAWVEREHNGDWRKALLQSPLLAFVQVQGFELLDGFHRLKLARAAGLEMIPVCFALDTDQEQT